MESLATDIWASECGLLSTNSKLLAVKQVPGEIKFGISLPMSNAPPSSSTSSGKRRRREPRHSTATPFLQLLVQDTGSGSMSILTTRWLVNAAGLSAQAVAQTITPTPTNIPRQYLAKGNYFSLGHKAPFSRLIYPVPEDGGLGVHLTLDLAGQARFGPDVEWVDNDRDYSVDAKRAEVRLLCFCSRFMCAHLGCPQCSQRHSYLVGRASAVLVRTCISVTTTPYALRRKF